MAASRQRRHTRSGEPSVHHSGGLNSIDWTPVTARCSGVPSPGALVKLPGSLYPAVVFAPIQACGNTLRVGAIGRAFFGGNR